MLGLRQTRMFVTLHGQMFLTRAHTHHHVKYGRLAQKDMAVLEKRPCSKRSTLASAKTKATTRTRAVLHDLSLLSFRVWSPFCAVFACR